MFLIHNNEVTDPAINLALEEHCLRNLDPACEYLLFYNNKPSVIIGRHQNPFQEFNQDLARRKNIQLVRRISGGGAVYHDPGNLNFSFITDFTEEKLDYFKTLLTPLLTTLRHLGVPAELTDKNTILVKGKKISGTSQHTNLRRMLSHGTLLFKSDLEVLERVLKPDLVITTSRAVPSIPGNVANIAEHLHRPLGMDGFRAELVEGMSRVFGKMISYRLTPGEWSAVDRLAKTKYKSWDWTFGRSPEFTVHHLIGLDSQKVEAHFMVKNGRIKDIQLADQFSKLPSVNQIRSEYIGERYDLWCSSGLTGP